MIKRKDFKMNISIKCNITYASIGFGMAYWLQMRYTHHLTILPEFNVEVLQWAIGFLLSFGIWNSLSAICKAIQKK